MQQHHAIVERILRLAAQLHRELGQQLSLEAYEAALSFEIEQWGLSVQRQQGILLLHDGEPVDLGFVADLLVSSAVVVRLGALHRLDPANEAWVLERLDLPGGRLGLFLDFRRPALESLLLPDGQV